MSNFGQIAQPRMEDLAQDKAASERRRKNFQQEEARYTVIFHKPRKDLGITINEYCLADTIQKLSGNRSGVPGWCYAKKEHLAKNLGFSRQSIHSMIKNLIKHGIIERSEETGYSRTTEVWYEKVETFKERLNKS